MAACPRPDTRATRRALFFLGASVAHVVEQVQGSGAGRVVTRTTTLEDSGEESVLTATLDPRGFATTARYRRGDVRKVALEELTQRGADPVVLIDLLGHVQPVAPTHVVLVDLSSGEALRGRVERRGAEVVALDPHGGIVARANVEGHRTGPGAFFEGDSPPAALSTPADIPTVDPRGVRAWRLLGISDALSALSAAGPGQRRDGDVVVRGVAASAAPPPEAHRHPALFLESDDPRVVAFATPHLASADVLERTTRLMEAIHPRVDGRQRSLPPSAVLMLERGGDCDGAAALLAASLRVGGTPARPVVGYRWVEGRFVPHAWTEVYTPAGWVLADASVPRLGDDPTYLKLFEGLGGALTMGRVLGRLQLQPLTDADRP